MKQLLPRVVSSISALIMLVPLSLFAAPPTTPKRVEGKVGQLVRIEVQPDDGKALTDIGYQPAFEESSDVTFDELAPRTGKRRFFVQSMVPGSFPVTFWTRGETTGVVCLVVVSGTAPVPPPTPTPVDQLTADLQALYNANPGTTKGADLKALSGVYKYGATSADDTDLKTYGDLYVRIKVQADSVLQPTTLTALRKRLQAEQVSVLGADQTTVLDATTRAKAKAEFARIATILDSLTTTK